MSKYEKLWEYVRNNATVELTFDQVQQICGFPIDHSFLNYKKELEGYGHRVEKISMKNRTVKFQPRKDKDAVNDHKEEDRIHAKAMEGSRR